MEQFTKYVERQIVAKTAGSSVPLVVSRRPLQSAAAGAAQALQTCPRAP